MDNKSVEKLESMLKNEGIVKSHNPFFVLICQADAYSL